MTVGLLLVFAAALFAVSASVLSGISRARLGAMHETSIGFRHRALERFVKHERFIFARWRALRALGLVSGTLVLSGQSAGSQLQVLGLVLVVYVALSELGAALLRASSERVAPTLLWLLRPFEILMVPFVDPFVLLTRFVAKPLKQSIPSPALAETEVELLVTEGEQSGALDHEQSEMIRNVLEFGDTEACELMVPRPQVRAIEVSTPPAEILKLIVEEEHSRYPVYRDSIDNIVGILHVKDLFLFTASHPLSALDIGKLLRKAAFVPETQRASSVLEEMRAGHHHMAVVLDEFGGVSGVLTLEDLLEEIVGEIEDEYDHDASPITRLSNGGFVVDASIPVADLNRQLGITLPDDEEYNSLGGYIVEEMGHVPAAGTALERAGLRFVVRMADERRVAKVEITPNALSATA